MQHGHLMIKLNMKSMQRYRIERFAALALATTLLVLAGCNAVAPDEKGLSFKHAAQEKSFFDRMPWGEKFGQDQPDPYPDPVKVATTWTPDTLVQTGRTPTRGFGGRIFFYDEKSRAVPVEGTLIVHGFDDGAETQEGRVKRFEFTPEQFTRHFSQTDLGASYSVWVPWDAIGGTQRRISLVTSFRTQDGKTVQGVPATVLLPGASTESKLDMKVSRLSPEYNNYLEATKSAASKTTGLTTTTIARRTRPSRSKINRTPQSLAKRTLKPADLTVSDPQTPFAELGMVSRPTQPKPLPTVLPVSAQVSPQD
jgi:hypothetical protein